MLFVLNDTISMNKVISRDWDITRSTYTKTIDRTIYKEPQGFYVGGFIHPDLQGIGISYLFGNNMLSVDFSTDQNLMIGYKYRILKH